MHGARPLRSTRRLQNYASALPKWYSIKNQASGPTLISIYDEVGFYGVPAAAFLDDLRQVPGDIELHLHSPGGDIYEGLAIYNGLLQARKRGNVQIVIDGLAASAASFIAMAASPGQLEISPHAEMMIHDGFCMAIGNAADMRELADQLDRESDNIAAIYGDRTGKPAAYWRDKMRAETWYQDSEAVAEGLADRIHGQEAPVADGWDMSVFSRYAGAPAAAAVIVNADGKRPARDESRDEDADDDHDDPDGDGDDDTTAEGDTDHDYAGAKPPRKVPGDRATFPVLNTDVDNSEWDASKAWHNGAESDDPAAFYKAICAGRRAGDPSKQSSWALPYRYTPSSPPNAAGVRAALSRLPSTEGLTNADEAKSKLQGLMKQVNPGYDPDALFSPAVVAQAFTLPRAELDDSPWEPNAMWAMAAASSDPEMFYRGVCAGRRRGDPATPAAWALPYRYAPDMPPNVSAVRKALAELPYVAHLANTDEAHGVLNTAMKAISPASEPDEINPELLSAALSLGLKGAGSK